MYAFVVFDFSFVFVVLRGFSVPKRRQGKGKNCEKLFYHLVALWGGVQPSKF